MKAEDRKHIKACSLSKTFINLSKVVKQKYPKMPGVVSLLAVLLTVSVVMKVIDAQSCSTGNCGSDYSTAIASSIVDKDKQCKAAREYLTCLETAVKDCSGDNDSLLEPAKKVLSDTGCSGSGAPVLGFLTIVLGFVISRYF